MGLGSTFALAGAVVSEVVFAALITVGLATRWAALPLIFTMVVAAFIVHGADPFFINKEGGSKEPALMYLFAYLTLLFTGAGRFSLDAIFGQKKSSLASN